MENLLEEVHGQKYTTCTQLAKLCGVSRQRIHKCIKEGKLKPSLTLGMMYCFSEAVVKTFKAKYFPTDFNNHGMKKARGIKDMENALLVMEKIKEVCHKN